jgi:hypothetical protein
MNSLINNQMTLGIFSFPFKILDFTILEIPMLSALPLQPLKPKIPKLLTHLATDFSFSLFVISGVLMTFNFTSPLLESGILNYQNPEKSTLCPTTLHDFGIFLSLCPVPLSTGFPI